MSENGWTIPQVTRRRFLGVAAAGAGLTLLGSCGGGESGSGGESSGGGGGGDQGDFLIGMSQANNAEPYREVMNDDIKKAASKVSGFEVAFADAAQDNSKQVSDVRNFLTQQVSLLIISPNEAAPLTSVVKEVYDQGIPVVVLDRMVNGDAYTTFIGADNFEIGRKVGEYYVKTLLPDGGNVVQLKGLPGSTPAQERENGFKKGIEGSDVKIIATGVGNWLRDEGRSQMDAILQANDKIDAVYSHNDPMAEGAFLAAKAVDRAGEMEFTGIDGLPIPSGGIKAVDAGRLSATFVYPTGGREAIEAAKKLLLQDEKVSKKQTLSTTRVTKDNAADVYKKLRG